MDMIREYPASGNQAALNKNAAKLRRHLETRAVSCSIHDINGLHVLHATTCPGKCPDYLLNAHMDVVPVIADEQKNPILKDGILHGRGALDCLGSVACISEILMNALGKANVSAFFTMDEELGGSTTKAMIEKGFTAKKSIVIIDGGFASIAYAQKGIISLRLTAHGRGGHSSTPWRFDNPIDRLLDGYFRLRSAWKQPTEQDFWQNSMSATVISGGKVTNQIPDTAELTLNIRYTDPENFDAIMRFVKEKTDLQVDLQRQSDPVSMSPDHPELHRLQSYYENALHGKTLRVERICGASDARHCSKLGIPVLIIGLDGQGVHSVDEYCRIASIDIVRDVVLDYINVQ